MYLFLMGRNRVFEKPITTSMTIDLLTAEIIHEYKFNNEPLYRTMNRIMQEYADPDVIKKCKAKLAAIQKNVLARVDRYGQTVQATLDDENQENKSSPNLLPVAEWKGMLKCDYIDMLAERYKVKKIHAFEEVQRRLKKGTLVERGGYVEEVLNV